MTKLPEEVFTYWDDLPIIVELDATLHDKINKNPLRDYIIKATSKGVIDPSKSIRRHALTVNEMLEIIEKTQGEKVNKSTLYYHLQVLVDLGIMQEVASIKEGNIITTYFGRTSKLVMLSLNREELKEDHPKKAAKAEGLEYMPDFKVFLQRMQEKHKSDEDIDDLIHVMQLQKQRVVHQEEKFKDWISTHAMELRGLDIDLIKIFLLYSDLLQLKQDRINIYERLEEILQVNEMS